MPNRNYDVVLSNVNAKYYSDESKPIKGPSILPRLPVPSLQQTIDKFLLTAKPHVTDAEFAATTELARKFASKDGIATKLQNLLIEKAQNSENWLAEWWLYAAYLDFREPVVVYSSPGLAFPLQNFKNESDFLTYTAKLILAAYDYKLQIDGYVETHALIRYSWLQFCVAATKFRWK